jgi:hypothetical protein
MTRLKWADGVLEQAASSEGLSLLFSSTGYYQCSRLPVEAEDRPPHLSGSFPRQCDRP